MEVIASTTAIRLTWTASAALHKLVVQQKVLVPTPIVLVSSLSEQLVAHDDVLLEARLVACTTVCCRQRRRDIISAALILRVFSDNV
jgi:hypothetical protein